MSQQYRNPLRNPVHYTTPQLRTKLNKFIVGAGAAGSVLASKLSEDPKETVLLLEAGGDNVNNDEIKVPLKFSKLFHTEHDWDYYTVEQPGLASRRSYWPPRSHDRWLNDDPTVFGVEFQTHRGGEHPELLLLSGIGPEEELSKHRIPIVRANDAVGKNLKDHLATTTIMCKAKPGARLDYLDSTLKAMPSIARYKLFGGGPLSSNAGEAATFFRSIGPDVESIGSPLAYIHHGEEAAPEGVGMFSLVPISLRQQRKGIITLNSRDAFDHPTIDPKYFSDAEDNDRTFLLVALRVSLRIMRSSALQQYLEPVPVNDDP
ncbi:hypothetical protein ETB97_008530 [Aspergillus alliaceus]|uniref:Glucose-methanol-choline oxidoreductase N-terminal domain-containing protein n=1 Tax=Petromyces alliaceus TaxID=209559 RepID=A0A8H6ACA9_PETAA|nr:hypothetical protein ETB97_008530 [Aspergillus burnettii]